MMIGFSGYDYGTLQNTGIFFIGVVIHIFEGELIAGAAQGYHYEGIPNTPGQVVPGTTTAPNRYGVYWAKVMVFGILKSGYSTFFPKSMSPQEVIDAINQAYHTRRPLTGTKNTYQGTASSGMKVKMYLNTANQIISAFPVY